MSEDEEVQVLYKTSCPNPECGSSDANAVYSDGHTYCFSCETWDKSEDVDGEYQPRKKKGSGMADMIHGDIQAIPARGLDEEVCKKYGYEVGTFNGDKCHIAPYYNEAGDMVAQKIRLRGKEFVTLGKIEKALPFFGQNLCRSGGKMIVITEGEIDAMSVTQAMGLSWPAVSLPKGAPNAPKTVAKALPFLNGFEKVVLCLDEDEKGREAVEKIANILPPGKCFIAKLPLKDANEMVKERRSKELVDAIWGAREYRPETIVDIDEIINEAATPVGWGKAWPWVSMTRATYGQQRGALYVWGAGTGSGKSTLMKQLMVTAMKPELCEDHSELGDIDMTPRKVGALFFEEHPAHTLKTLAGMEMRRRVHVPGTEYDQDEHRKVMESYKGLLFPIRMRSRSWSDVEATIRYLHHAEGIEDFFIDPMTALVATAEDERRALDGIMAELAGLCEELIITVHLVSHLSTPDGKSHEEGGRIAEKHFRGSRAVAYWAHYMIGMERDKQDPDCPTTIRGLKDRLTGDAVGPFMALAYDRDSGLMVEAELPDGDTPFKDETDDDL